MNTGPVASIGMFGAKFFKSEKGNFPPVFPSFCMRVLYLPHCIYTESTWRKLLLFLRIACNTPTHTERASVLEICECVFRHFPTSIHRFGSVAFAQPYIAHSFGFFLPMPCLFPLLQTFHRHIVVRDFFSFSSWHIVFHPGSFRAKRVFCLPEEWKKGWSKLRFGIGAEKRTLHSEPMLWALEDPPPVLSE